MEKLSSLTATQGYIILVAYGIFMILITYFFARWKKYKTISGFLVAERNVNWWLGASSIAASWIWAPALFISVQMSYQRGLPGIFWFVIPNILALIIYIFLAPKIREKMPYGYTLPQYIKHRLQNKNVHKIFLIPYLFYQLMAVAVQLFAGGSLITLLTNIPFLNAIVIMAIIVLIYSLISGLESSIVTDFVQFILIVIGVAVIVPWIVIKTGGTSLINTGLGGATGEFRNVFDPSVAFSFGIVTTISLLSGSISDQQYWQRAFAIKKQNLVKSFAFGAFIFGIIPTALSILGFLAANKSLNVVLPAGTDVSMIGIALIGKFLPVGAIALFVIMLISALFSTMDSALNAASSLYVKDMLTYSEKEKMILEKADKGEKLNSEEQNLNNELNAKGVRNSKKAMIGITIMGILIAIAAKYIPGFGLKHLWWIFNSVAACVIVPTILSLYWDKLSGRGVFWGVLIALIAGVPLFIYGNIIDNPTWIVGASLFIIAITTICCFGFAQTQKRNQIYDEA